MGNVVIIKAKIRTEAPLSIKMPVAEGARENEFDNFPVMTRGVDADGKPLRTGFLPATTLRGYLRRAVTIRNMQKAAEEGKPYKLAQVYSEMIGQDAASEQQSDEIDLLALKAAREASPILDLFGSGLGIKSRLKVSHFVPEVNVLPEVFTGVRKDLDDTEDALDWLDENEKLSFMGRSESNNRRAKALSLFKQQERKVKQAERKGEVSQDDLKALEIAKAEVEKFKAEMGDMQVSTRTIVQHYALPAGLDLHGKLVIDKATDVDIELIEYGLKKLSMMTYLGAHSARGCGDISGVFDFYDSDGKQLKSVSIGGWTHAKVVNF